MNSSSLPLTILDARRLDEETRALLRPGELVPDRKGRKRRLPRFFYEVPTWKTALDLQLTPHFSLWEFMDVDVREAEGMRMFPRYVPCALAHLAVHLEVFREEVGTFVHIAANGGYRSPSHRLYGHASPHSWGTAANIYRVGDDYLDSREKIERFSRIASELLPGVWTREYGSGVGCADDHMHLDLGYLSVVPPGAPSEEDDESSSSPEEGTSTAEDSQQ